MAEAPAREVEPSREVPEPAIPVTTAGPKWELDQEPAPAEAEVIFERNLRAKHYRLTLRRDGVPVATIPARGTERAARAFVAEHADWLARARERHRTKPRQATHWRIGTPVLWRGKWTEIRQAATSPHLKVSVGADVFRVPRFDGDLRPTIEAAFQRRAKIELPARTWELGAVTQMAVKRVSVRNQRSRWGSCTEAGVISLNWRLILSPPWVSDYVIYHELMHLKEMNHSKRFWAAVAQVCPRWQEAEAWLDQHGSYLGL
ncbi:M48 family metallopeptidase [Synoicihabitans lomoniglobus]|uniref:SprT family zinc-dependent metalloprotease n=1 Tax=Synoicihabitans lomoniglobus TaxID=2909285 RepID=A0AAF0CGZ0_9BACT|nr:M48 family metallopeptidase [Opitutaceae bacterium LMO-M01]WED63812.1 SprT family zinc-dependent metalloprotease [Opitutaceae bacterium LMO-M01]